MSGLELTGATFWGGRPVARRVSDARPQARAAVSGIITATQTVTVGRGPAYRCTLTDGTGEIYVLFLGRTEVPGLTAGRRVSVTGTAGTTTPTSGTATVSWVAPTENSNGTALTNLAGYTVYYGTDASTLSQGQSVKVANPAALSYTVSGLASGTWYFAVASYTTGGQASALSAVSSKTI